MAVTVTARDGVRTTCSSWLAWRSNIALIRRRPCHACDGEGYVEQIAMRAGGKGWRWYSVQCKRCAGTGIAEERI